MTNKFTQGDRSIFGETGDERPSVGEARKYPNALSREAFTEGGYTFLKRALKQALDTDQPVVINSGRNYLQYVYSAGQGNFMEGVTVLQGDDKEALDAFKGVAEKYLVSQGVKELKG